MDLRDFIVTPLLLAIVYSLAYVVRPYVTDAVTRGYFLPAISVRIFGALALGFTYQFYYNGGDTFNFHTHGSRVIWEAFSDSVESGLRLLFSDGHHQSLYKYTSRIYFYKDPASFFVIRIAALFDMLTFSSYSGTAILFSLIGFSGSWMFFLTFYNQYPTFHRPLAWAALFIPSVIFWGSGVLKDTIMLACLGIATWQIYKIFIRQKVTGLSIFLLVISLVSVFLVKKFILQAFLPAAINWVFAARFYSIRSVMIRVMIIPVLIFATVALAWVAALKIGEGDERYSVDKIAKTARITAYDIRYWSGRKAGSGYSLGVLDDSFVGLVKLAPQAINVTLFRPYLWEVKNPLMLLSAMESLMLLLFCLYVIIRRRLAILSTLSDPNVLFCLVFSITYAFAVGVSTFNFGTLARYKITMLPFFLTALVLLNYAKSARNADELEVTE